MSLFFGTLDAKSQETVLEEIGRDAAILYKDYFDSLVNAFKFAKPRAGDRLEFYRNRMPEVWSQLQQSDPALYDTQIKDWQKIELSQMQRQLAAFNPFFERDRKSGMPAFETTGDFQ